MSKVYFMYKIPRNKGPIVHNLADIGEWRVAETDKPERLWKELKCLYPMIIDEDTANGFKYINVTQVPVDSKDPEGEKRELNSDELELKSLAQKAKNKLLVRSLIESKVGDINDVVADLCKVVYLLINELHSNKNISDDLNGIITNILSAYGIDGLTEKLKKRNDAVASILNEYY